MRFDRAFDLELNRFEVDFHIPELSQDARLAIDPFLMFKSRHELFVAWHERLLSYWQHVLELLRSGSTDDALSALLNPEPVEVRLGYASAGAGGSGIGPEIAGEMVEVVSTNRGLLKRGLRHLEELQLYSVGIGADRLSDLAANVLKTDLVRYTVLQAGLPQIRLTPEL